MISEGDPDPAMALKPATSWAELAFEKSFSFALESDDVGAAVGIASRDRIRNNFECETYAAL